MSFKKHEPEKPGTHDHAGTIYRIFSNPDMINDKQAQEQERLLRMRTEEYAGYRANIRASDTHRMADFGFERVSFDIEAMREHVSHTANLSPLAHDIWNAIRHDDAITGAYREMIYPIMAKVFQVLANEEQNRLAQRKRWEELSRQEGQRVIRTARMLVAAFYNAQARRSFDYFIPAIEEMDAVLYDLDHKDDDDDDG